jgi:hypothetical protein
MDDEGQPEDDRTGAGAEGSVPDASAPVEPPPAPPSFAPPTAVSPAYAPPVPTYAAPSGYRAPSPYGTPPFGPTGSFVPPYAMPPGAPGHGPYGPTGGWVPPGADPTLGPYTASAPTTGRYVPPYASGVYQHEPQGWQPPSQPPETVAVRSTGERRHAFRQGFLIALVIVVVVGVGFTVGALLAPGSPKTTAVGLVKSSLSAGAQAGTFHYVELSTTNGSPNDITGDAAPDSGRQTITAAGASGRDVFDLRLLKGVVYFRGNRAAVIDQLGVPAGKAAPVVAKWVSIHKGQGAYKTFAAGITTSSNLSQVPRTFVAMSSDDVAGSSPPATRIQGALNAGKNKPAVGSAAYVVDTASTLPKSLDGEAVGTGGQLSLSWTFSAWHQKVVVVAPAGAVPYASVGATSSK